MHSVKATDAPERIREFCRVKRSGSVRFYRGRPTFTDNGDFVRRRVTFHTHSVARPSGYQPPSCQDLRYFIDNPVTHTHFVLTRIGVYIMSKRFCNMSAPARRKILRLIRRLQGVEKPGPVYHRLFLREVSRVCPPALKIEFLTLPALARRQFDLKSIQAPTQPCGL